VWNGLLSKLAELASIFELDKHTASDSQAWLALHLSTTVRTSPKGRWRGGAGRGGGVPSGLCNSLAP